MPLNPEKSTPPLAISATLPRVVMEHHEWEQLASILKHHLPGRTVWAFGSRARGKHVKRFSDLDLAVEGLELTLLEAALLREVFDECPLPFKVDIVQIESLTPEFRTRIEAEKVLLQGVE